MLFRDRDVDRSVRVVAGGRPSRGRSLILLAVALALSLLRLGPQTGMAQDDPIATGQGPVYLPYLSLPAPKPPADDARRLREVATLGGRPEALVISGKLLYLGVGSAVETYDISVPGQARRLARSGAVEGRIVRLTLGSDRLFALSRPVIDWSAPPLDPDDAPPWTLLSVFDLSDPAAPRRLGRTTPITGRTEEGARINWFATDLAAHGRVAYLTVFERNRQRMGLDEARLMGMMIVDSRSDPLHYQLDQDLFLRGFRVIVHGDRLYVRGDLPERRVQEHGFRTGVMGFDLKEPLAPQWLGVAGTAWLDNSLTVFDLVGQAEHLFHVSETAFLVPIEVLADGRPQLMVDWRNVDDLVALDLDTDVYLLLRSAAGPGRIYLLLPSHGDEPVLSIDVRDPLHPEKLPSIGIGGLDLEIGDAAMNDRYLKPDLGADIAATTDGRLFVASGSAHVLVELAVRDPDNQHELARYSIGQSPDCSLIAGGKLIQVDLSAGALTLRDLADPEQLPLVGTTPVDLGTTCTLAADGPWLYAAGSKGLTVLDLSDPAAPRPRGSLALEGEARQVLADGPRVYLAAGREGLWTVDVSDPDQPAVLGHLASPSSTQGVAADGDRLYLADGPAGLTVVDVSDPSAPRETEALLQGEEILAVARHGDWVYASGVHRDQPRAAPRLAELINLQGDGSLKVRSRWPLEDGSAGFLAIDRSTGTDLFIQDGPGGVRWLDLTAGLPQSRDLVTLDGPLDALVAGEGWVLAGGPSLRLLRRDDP